MTKEYLTAVISHYYDQLDYPDFIELLKYKVINTNSDIDISEIELKKYGENKRYNNPYIQQPDNYIEGWNKTAADNEYQQCVKFSLRSAYNQLLPRLKNKQVLSDSYMDSFFKDKGGFNIKNILLFVEKELENKATIYILDPTGNHIIAKHTAVNQEATLTVDGDIHNTKRIWSASSALIMNSNHVDLITEPNVLRSLATGTTPRLFDVFNDSNDYTFELFKRPENSNSSRLSRHYRAS
jgi:hypothetical protein